MSVRINYELGHQKLRIIDLIYFLSNTSRDKFSLEKYSILERGDEERKLKRKESLNLRKFEKHKTNGFINDNLDLLFVETFRSTRGGRFFA